MCRWKESKGKKEKKKVGKDSVVAIACFGISGRKVRGASLAPTLASGRTLNPFAKMIIEMITTEGDRTSVKGQSHGWEGLKDQRKIPVA